MDLFLKKTKFGKGVFAGRDFKKGEEIIEFKGRLMRKEELLPLNNPEDDRYLQVGLEVYIGPSNEMDDLINHSCNPNSGIKKIEDRFILIAIRNIRGGEEITWDYSTTMAEDNWDFLFTTPLDNS